MRYASSTVLLMLLCFSAFGQKMPSDYFDEGVIFSEDNNNQEALKSFQYIVDNHPKNELYPKAYYNMGYLYLQEKQFNNAEEIFESILVSEFNETEELGGGIMADPYTNFRHRAAKHLYQIYFESKRYDTALYYLSLSDTAYPYLHFCGNEFAANDVYMSLTYADVYEKLNNSEGAIQALLNSVFIELEDNSKVISRLKGHFKKDKNRKLLKQELDNALNEMYLKNFKSGDYEYSRYYFMFQGAEIYVPGVYIDWDNFNKEETISEIEKTEFYKMVKSI